MHHTSEGDGQNVTVTGVMVAIVWKMINVFQFDAQQMRMDT